MGFIGGVALFTGCNQLLIRSGGQHRKRSGCDPCERQTASAGLAIALGTLLDGVPESFVVGVSTLGGGHQSALAVGAFFLANFPEALSSTAGMKQAGRTSAFIFGLWGGIVTASAAAAAIGHYVLAGEAGSGAALALGVAGGAIVAMVVDTMLPEATDDAHRFTGIIAASGFLAAFILSRTLSGE
jgi:zinc transporter, ZIP family